MKINWKRKLSSRKFWSAAVAWLTSVLAAFNVNEAAISQTAIIVTGIGSLVAYILAETYIDAHRGAESEEEK